MQQPTDYKKSNHKKQEIDNPARRVSDFQIRKLTRRNQSERVGGGRSGNGEWQQEDWAL